MEWLFICVALIPLMFCPTFLFNGFALPQILAVSLLSTASLAIGVWGGVLPNFSLAPIGLSFLFLIYVCLSTLWTDPQHNAKKELGLQAPLILLFLTSSIWMTKDMIGIFALTSTIAATLSAFYGHVQTLSIDPFFPNNVKKGEPTNNAIGTIGNPNFLASYLGPCFWLAIYSALVFESSLFALAGYIAYIIIFKTKVRAGLIALIGSGLFFILTCAYFNLIQNGDLIFHLGLALVIFLLLTAIVIIKEEWKTFWWKPIDPDGPGVWYGSFRYRLCYWLIGLFLWTKKPWFGWGLWGYRKEVYQAQARINDMWPGFMDKNRYITPQPRECHNDYIEHLVEYGLIGFLIFISFLVTVFIGGISCLNILVGTREFFLILLLLAGLVSILINAFFFFGLRIPSTAMIFWIICSMIISFQENSFQIFNSNFWITLIVCTLGIGFIWECVIKRVLASRYFYCFLTGNDPTKKVNDISKASYYAPFDTMIRTYASIFFADFDLLLASNHSSKAVSYYDGQTPLWCTLYNAGLYVAKFSSQVLEEANAYLKGSHYLLPYFSPTKNLLNGNQSVSLRSQYKGGSATMRIVNGETAWRIRALIEKKGSCQRDMVLLDGEIEKVNLKKEITHHQMLLCDSNIENAILMEKKRLNIPDDWIYESEQGMFKDSETLTEEEKTGLGVS